jgi:hypothetical protein
MLAADRTATQLDDVRTLHRILGGAENLALGNLLQPLTAAAVLILKQKNIALQIDALFLWHTQAGGDRLLQLVFLGTLSKKTNRHMGTSRYVFRLAAF